MRTVPRRTFAVPLVAIACSGSSDGGSTFARLHRDGTACTYHRDYSCPKGATCNPPPPQAVECPAEMGKAEWAQIGPAKTQGACVLLVEPCTDASCGTPTACLSPTWEPLPALQWTIAPGEGANARCTATAAGRTARWSAPGTAFAIDCPPSLADRTGFIERADVNASCVACATSPCDPATSAAVACPTEPSTTPSPAGTP